jgi:hypothetical protein
MNTHNENSPFGNVIYAYTRKQAIADGFQVEVTKTAQEAGIRFPVFITRTAFDAYVTICGGFNKTLCLLGFARTMDGHCQQKCQSRGGW